MVCVGLFRTFCPSAVYMGLPCIMGYKGGTVLAVLMLRPRM